jgi:cell division septum initiation protein DivIVA
MSRHIARSLEASSQEPGPVGSENAVAGARRPNLSGDLEGMLAPAPVFRRRPLGYDRLPVDNYVAWAETALLAARQETDDLLDRYGRCWAELDLTRQAQVHSLAGQQMAHVTERIGSMLQLAADEAAELTAAAAAEAERAQSEARAEAARVQSEARDDAQRVKSEARADADSQLLRAHEAKELAVADAARLRRDSEVDRAEATAARQQAERDVDELVHQAAEERSRLDEEAAQTRARLDAEAAERIRQQLEVARTRQEAAEAAALERLARVEEEAAELERRRDVAQASLIRLCNQVSEAIAAVDESLPAPGLRLAPPRQAAS